MDAQVNCEDCSTGPPQEVQIDLCTFNNTIQVNYFNVPGGPFDLDLIDAPLVKVILVYRIQYCPDGTQSLIIDDYVYMDLRQYWETVFLRYNQFGSSTGHNIVSLNVVPANINCDYDISLEPVTEWHRIMTSAVDEAIDRLLLDVGITTQGNYTVIKKGTCWSKVEVELPVGSFILSNPDDNNSTVIRTVGIGGADIVQYIPCNDNCCKSQYSWTEVELLNGSTRWLWKRISVEGDQGSCEQQPLPDYNSYPGRMKAKMIDPNTGDTIDIYGTVKKQDACMQSCDYDEPPTTTGFIQKENNEYEELLLIPTSNSEYLNVKTSKEIKTIVVFSLNGQKIENDVKYEHNQLHISTLKNGIYIARIYFSDNSYKTTQFIK